MADYYMCSPGDIYRAAIPAGFKAEVTSYKPKTACYLRIGKAWTEEKKLHQLLDKLTRAPVQQKLVIRYLETSGFPGKRRPGAAPAAGRFQTAPPPLAEPAPLEKTARHCLAVR